MTATRTIWITCPRPNPRARLRLFCLPYAGGAASAFYTWPNDLPRDVEVCPLQLPGRENRLGEPLYTNMIPLVQSALQGIRPYLDKPFVLFGHSMGAKIGFELARQLRRQREPAPLYLFVSGNRAPHIVEPRPIHHLPEEEFLKELRRFNGTPEVVLQNPELMRLFLPILRADLTVDETYAYMDEKPLDCPISVFGGFEDSEIRQDELEAWQMHTNRTFRLYMLPGDHFFLRTAQVSLLQTIGRNIVQAMASS